jgi:hypothetical protein
MSRTTARLLAVGIIAAAALWFVYGFALGQTTPATCARVTLPVVVNLDDVKHADLIAHERAAIERGEPRQVTLERDNAAARRVQDLRGIPTRPGFDRDEWPPAFTEEAGLHSDGSRADVAYVESSENRSGGAVMGAALRGFCDGQRFIVEAGTP